MTRIAGCRCSSDPSATGRRRRERRLTAPSIRTMQASVGAGAVANECAPCVVRAGMRRPFAPVALSGHWSPARPARARAGTPRSARPVEHWPGHSRLVPVAPDADSVVSGAVWRRRFGLAQSARSLFFVSLLPASVALGQAAMACVRSRPPPPPGDLRPYPGRPANRPDDRRAADQIVAQLTNSGSSNLDSPLCPILHTAETQRNAERLNWVLHQVTPE